MGVIFIKLKHNGEIGRYKLIDGKVKATFMVGYVWVCNPPLELLLNNGWEVVE